MSIHTGKIAPDVKASDAIWLSTSILDMDPSPQPSMRKTVLVKDQSYETSYIQEPSVWHHDGLWHMIYACGAGAGYASAASPTGPWKKHSALALGNGVNGLAGAPSHQTVFRDGNTLYMTFIDTNATTKFSQATASVDNPLVWTVNAGFNFDPGSAYRSGGLGNTWTIKVGDLYYMFFEASYGTYGWQIGLAVSSSPSGAFSVIQFPLVDLAAAKGTFGDVLGPKFFPCGNMCVLEENGQFVMYYGAKLTNGGLNDIYRAYSTDLLTWENRDGNLPVFRRNGQLEVDQTVDPMLCKAENGSWWMFYSQMDNVTAVGSVAAVPLSPAIMMFDGQKYRKSATFVDGMGVKELRTTPIFTSSTYQLANGERAVADTTSAGITVTLPRAAQGARCSVVNAGPTGGVNTVTVSPHASDSVSNAGSALSVGQVAIYECYAANRWSRI